MYLVVGVIWLALLAGLVFLARFVARGGGPKTTLWLALLVVGTALTLIFVQIVGIYYVIPVVWIVVIVLAVAVLVALFVQVGRELQWVPARLLAVVGLMLGAFLLSMMALMFMPTGDWFMPLFEVRAQQIAEAAGFTVLVPPGEDMATDSLPVDVVPEPDEGVQIQYERFVLQERVAEGAYSLEDLAKITAPGEDPMGFGGSIPDDAIYKDLEVDGRPAVGVQYTEGDDLPDKQSVLHLVVFEVDGVDVRMESRSAMSYTGADEEYEFVPALTFSQMVAIAETLEPLE